MKRRLSIPFVLWIVIHLAASANAADHRVVALTGGAAPDTSPGVVFDDLTKPRIDEQGRVAFLADIVGPGVDETNAFGAWSEDSGTLRLLARDADPAPGMAPGVILDMSYTDFVFIAAGKASFRAAVTGPGVPFATAGWAGPTGALSLVASSDDPALDIPAGNNIFAVQLDPAGKSLMHTEPVWEQWTDRNGPLERLVGDGDSAPEGGGIIYGSVGPIDFNKRSEFLLSADRAGPGVTVQNDDALYFESDGVFELVALEGDPAPNTIPGATYSGKPVSGNLNDLGQIAFWSAVAGGPVMAIFSNRGGSFAPEVQYQDAAPGTSANFEFIYQPVLNNTGRLAFRATTQAGQLYGIWWDQATPGVFSKLIQPNEPMPGTGKRFVSAQNLWYSSSGRLLADASTTDTATGSKKSLVLFEPDGTARILARAGDPFDVLGDGSDLRSVSTIDSVTGLSENGSAVFLLNFSGGSSGIFASTALSSIGPGLTNNLTVAKNAGMLDLDWGADCGTGTSYGIYRGDLSLGLSSVQSEPGQCNVFGTDATIPMGLGPTEFLLVVPNDGGAEGSYGLDSAGLSRPAAVAPCYPTAVVDDCAGP